MTMNQDGPTELEQRATEIIELAADIDFGSSSAPTLSSLKTRHREIARLMLLGKTNNEISEMVGITAARISQIKSDPMFVGYLASLEEQCDSSLKTRHREIARLMLLGKTNNEIAELVGITPGRISQIKSDPMFLGYLSSLEEKCDRQVIDVRQRLADISHKALDVVEELLADDKSSIKLAAAKDILDRAGYKPIEKVATVNLSSVLSQDELQAIRDNITRAKEEGYVVSEDSCGRTDS